MVIKFERWDINLIDYEIYTIRGNGTENLGAFVDESRDTHNSILRFNNDNDFNPDIMTDIVQAIKDEFGNKLFKISIQ
jgi:hypothetical protein